MDPDVIGGTPGPDDGGANDLLSPMAGNQDPIQTPDPAAPADPAADPNVDPAAPAAPATTDEEKFTLPDGRVVDRETALKEFKSFYPDYTRKSQAAKEAEELKIQNKQLMEILNKSPQPDPNIGLTPQEIEARQVLETMEQRSLSKAREEIMPQIEEIKVKNECNALAQKYKDFDQDAVLAFALEKGGGMIRDLESAYFLLNRNAHIEQAKSETQNATITNMARKGPASVVPGSSNANPGASGIKPYNKEADKGKSTKELMNEGMRELGLM